MVGRPKQLYLYINFGSQLLCPGGGQKRSARASQPMSLSQTDTCLPRWGQAPGDPHRLIRLASVSSSLGLGQARLHSWGVEPGTIPRLGKGPGMGLVSKGEPKTHLPAVEHSPHSKGWQGRPHTLRRHQEGAFQGDPVFWAGLELPQTGRGWQSEAKEGTTERTARPAPARPPEGPTMAGECECVCVCE